MAEAKPNLWLVVETIDMVSGDTEAKKIIDHNNRHDRVWLGKHSFWAFRSGKGVVTYPSSEATKAEAVAALKEEAA